MRLVGKCECVKCLKQRLAHYCLPFYGGCLPALLPWNSPAPDPGLAMPVIPGGLRPFSLTYVWGGGATALQNRPTPARAHIISEDGQLPALQHVFQFFVGCGPSGCGEEGLHAQGLGQPALGWGRDPGPHPPLGP